MTEIHKRSVAAQNGAALTTTKNMMKGTPSKQSSNQRRVETIASSSAFDLPKKDYLSVWLYNRSPWHVGASLLLLVYLLATLSSRWGANPAFDMTSTVSKSLSTSFTQGPKLVPRMVHKDTNTTRPPHQRDRPYFVFHIGPPKTATTSFQWAMTRYKDVLPRDSYHYLGQTMLSESNM